MSPTRATQIQPGGIVAGYRIEERLGAGGMGVVYRAVQLDLQREVAIKVLAPGLELESSARARFLQEALLTARISHPNLVKVLHSGESEWGLFIAFELVRGRTLKERLDQVCSLALSEALDVTRAIADVLGTLHEAGIIHRDVKPANVFLTDDRGALLADLGIARARSDGAVHTEAGLTLGTPGYMAPELIRGEPPSPASDLYALAVLFYECVAGRPPFMAENVLDLLGCHLRDPVPPIRRIVDDCPAAVDRFLAKALAKSCTDRHRDAAAFQTALDAISRRAGAGPVSRGLTRPSPATVSLVPLSRAPLTTAAASVASTTGSRRVLAFGALLCALVAVLLLALRPGGQDRLRPPQPPPALGTGQNVGSSGSTRDVMSLTVELEKRGNDAMDDVRRRSQGGRDDVVLDGEGRHQARVAGDVRRPRLRQV
ncbi:MAG: serine/threonine protein kinase, partial [Candidatus Riflebacteria bacterium]|nr:serine/threonine protein kinase [Candidatus Riflebacteria bacterium]